VDPEPLIDETVPVAEPVVVRVKSAASTPVTAALKVAVKSTLVAEV
jgi:hypothetical protein